LFITCETGRQARGPGQFSKEAEMTYEYVYAIAQEEDGSAVLDFEKFPEIVCEITKTDVEQEKVKSIAFDAVKNALQARIDYNDDIPASDKALSDKNGQVVALSPLDILKLSLYRAFRDAKCSRTEFAKRASVTLTGLVRAFDLYHASRFDVLIDMFAKLGYSVSANIDVRKTATGR
jgi:hypothetical protein